MDSVSTLAVSWPTKLLPWLTQHTVYPKKYAHGFVVNCFVVAMQSFILNSHEVFIHIHQGCFAGTGAIVRLPQCQWSKPDGYGKISQCITTTKHSKAKTVCIFLGIYCTPLGQFNTLWIYYTNMSNYTPTMYVISARGPFLRIPDYTRCYGIPLYSVYISNYDFMKRCFRRSDRLSL